MFNTFSIGQSNDAGCLDGRESVRYDRAMVIKRVCVYCASSRQCDAEYHDAAARLGRELARNKVTLVYGGGSVGSMGHLADAALAEDGRVIGVLPRFMYDLEWGHRGLSELLIVNDLHERKRMMIEEVDAVIALPGGCGTLEQSRLANAARPFDQAYLPATASRRG